MSKFDYQKFGDRNQRQVQDRNDSVKPVLPASGQLRSRCIVDSVARLAIPGHYPEFESYVDLERARGADVAVKALAHWMLSIGFERNFRDEAEHLAEGIGSALADEVIWRMMNHVTKKGVIHNGIGWFRKVCSVVSSRAPRG